MLEWLKNKTKTTLGLTDDVDIYYGKLKVATIPKHILKSRMGKNKKTSINFDMSDYKFDIQNIPYCDKEIPSEIGIDYKTKQITQLEYVIGGLGYFARIDCTKPVHIIIKNGKVEREVYGSFMFDDQNYKEYNYYSAKEIDGLNSYTLPKQIIYCDDGSIDQDQSVWIVSKPNDKKITYTQREYKELLKPININADNYKNFTGYEKKIIHMYLNYTIYEKELSELGIECSQEAIVKNINLIEMYYI